MAEELEIKLTLSPVAMAAALEWLSSRPETDVKAAVTLANRYYDTPAADLNRQRIALRVRAAGARYIQTLKTQGEFVDGAHRRQEWEWPLVGAELNLGLIADTPVAQDINLAQLAPVFETNFERQVVMLDDGEALIECALDRGTVAAGNTQRRLNEVELELKKGSGARLRHWANLLARDVPVFLNLVSKAEQGYWLAGVHEPRAVVGTDAVSGFLQSLSVGWLVNEVPDQWRSHLDAIQSLTETRGLVREWDWLYDQFENGRQPGHLLADRRLGQLQLGLLG